MANITICEHVTFCHISFKKKMVRNYLKHHSKEQAEASCPRICIPSGSKPRLYTDSKQYSEACSAVRSIQKQQAVQQKQYVVTARSVASSSSTSSYAYLQHVAATRNYCCCMRLQLLLHEVYDQQQQHTTALLYAAYSKQQQRYLVRTHAYAYVRT